MKVAVKKTSKLKRDLAVEVTPEKMKDIREKILQRVQEQVTVAGFRKGKAPRDMIEKQHAGLIREEIIKEAVPHFYQDALKEAGVEPVSMPRIHDVDLRDGNLMFMAEVEVKPEVKIDDKVYKKIKLKMTPLSVSEDEINEFVNSLKDNLAATLGKNKEDIETGFAAHWSGYENEEEFISAVRSELHLNKVVERRRSIEKQVNDTLLSKCTFDLPESIVEDQKQRLVHHQTQMLAQRGIARDDVQKHYDEIAKKAESVAVEQVKLYYIMETIAQNEGLKYNQNNLPEVVVGFILSNQNV
jgi:FKBP-type peptidyl-prolyl cis-trans isomerase (trigger factor)